MRCEDCESCLQIGEGDHVCEEEGYVIVFSGYQPTDNYCSCLRGTNKGENQ